MDTALVDRIVADVLAHLGQLGERAPSGGSSSDGSSNTSPSKSDSHGGCHCGCSKGASATGKTCANSAAAGNSAITGNSAAPNSPQKKLDELTLIDRLITLRDLDGRLKGIRHLLVPAKAIVTPAVVDLLREKGISLRRVATGSKPSGAKIAVTLGVAETTFNPTSLLGQLSDLADVQQVARTGLASVVDDVADQVARGGRLGIIFTDLGAPAACLANRVRGVRAVFALDVRRSRLAVDAVGANLLVLEPSAASPNDTARIALDFIAGGNRTCPAAWQTRLG